MTIPIKKCTNYVSYNGNVTLVTQLCDLCVIPKNYMDVFREYRRGFCGIYEVAVV